MKIVVSRTDRAGDLILTTPILRELKKNFPEAKIIAHVKRYTSSILRLCPWVDETIIDEDFPSTLTLSKKLTSIKPDRIIIVHPCKKIMTAAFLARIPIRTGRASNVWQFFLNDRRVQKRSKNETHEFIYNLHLLDGIVDEIDFSSPSFFLPAKELAFGAAFLQKAGMEGKKPIVIHPGHGGSAFNVSPEQYAELAELLINGQFPVLISFGPGEERLKEKFPQPKKGIVDFLTNVPDFAHLAGIFAHCRAFVSGSTGPMHLAAALKLPVVAFFPPVAAMTPVRWGPVCDKNLVTIPDMTACNASCAKCLHRECMLTLRMDAAFQWLERTLKNESSYSDKR